jgi:hypothetical protein
MTALEDDSDPTYTHFAHHDEFFSAHTELVDSASAIEKEAEWVAAMGAIVSSM